MKINYTKLFSAIILTEAVGVIGSFFTTPNISSWYSNMNKSPLTPPGWVFAPVWTILFALMGVSLYLVYNKFKKEKRSITALVVFAVQLVLNLFWSILFFGLHNPSAAFVEIVFLWLAILLTIILFFRISRPAAYLLIPYILWVSFASYLNYSFLILNNTNPQENLAPINTSIDNQAKTTAENPTNIVGIANPASVNCTKNGGNLQIEKKPDGGEYGLCYFDDARACEEWAMFRGDCKVGGRKTTGFDTIEQKYCAWVGGDTTATPGAICTFQDGSTCDLDKLYVGECQKGQNLKEKEISKIIKTLETNCETKDDCELPFEYAIKSSGPYSSDCLNKKCAVVIYKY